jgi:hypothetical protein
MKPTNRGQKRKLGTEEARSSGMRLATGLEGKIGLEGSLYAHFVGRLSRSYRAMIVSLFSLIAFFSLVDLATSFVAYKDGLVEGNALLLGGSQLLGMSVFNVLAASKLAFVLGMGGVAVMGAWSRDSITTKLTSVVLVAFAMIFALVSFNNLVAIGTF